MLMKRRGVNGVMSGILVLALGLSGVLAGCAPPPKKDASSGADGRAIIKVNPHPRGAFEIIEQDGTEYRVARGDEGRPGGTFYTASIGDGPKTFNPWASYDATSSEMGSMLMMGLVETDAYTGEVIPALAKSVAVDPDGLTYTVILRKGLKWSDGKPLTAKDVVFTWNEIVKPGLGNPSTRDTLLVDGKFPEVKALDPMTIQFKTAKPFAPFLRQLGEPIAPAHIFKPIVDKGGDKAFSAVWGTSDASRHPEKFVSSNMWLLDKYDTSEQQVVFKRNPAFAMVDKRGVKLPYLERYVIRFVQNMNNVQLQFEQGKLDIYPVGGQFLSHVRKLKNPEFSLYNLGPTTGTTFMVFNLNPRKHPETGKPLVNPVKSRWFNSREFRKAVDWAVNRNDMVKNILKGVGQPLFTAESPSSRFINKRLAKGHPQDVEAAKNLLRRGGFTWNKEGQLLDDKGNRVEFDLLTNTGNDQREATGVSIKQDLEALGIQVNFKPMDFNVLVGKMNVGEWEAMIMGLTGSLLEPHGGANVWKSDAGLHMFNQRNVKTGHVDLSDQLSWEKELDKVFEEGAQVFDTEARRKIYNRYQQIAYDEAPFIYLYSPLSVVAVKTRLKNVDPTPLGGVTHNLEEIWIDEVLSSAKDKAPGV